MFYSTCSSILNLSSTMVLRVSVWPWRQNNIRRVLELPYQTPVTHVLAYKIYIHVNVRVGAPVPRVARAVTPVIPAPSCNVPPASTCRTPRGAHPPGTPQRPPASTCMIPRDYYPPFFSVLRNVRIIAILCAEWWGLDGQRGCQESCNEWAMVGSRRACSGGSLWSLLSPGYCQDRGLYPAARGRGGPLKEVRTPSGEV